MSILVTGGTGQVGSLVVKELVARGADVKILTRDPGKVHAAKGITAVAGDLLEPATVKRVFDGVDGVFLLNAVSRTESSEALMAITGMRFTGVTRVVYLSVQDADVAAWLPHFGAKVGAEAALEVSGIPFTILRPNNFFQNDYYFKDVLLQYGLYPQPIGSRGLSRVDSAIAAASAMSRTSTRERPRLPIGCGYRPY